MHIEVIADGLGFTEGPVWLPDGRVALTSINQGCVYVVDPSGGPRERIDTGGGPNGLACSADGTLYVAQNGGAWGASGPAEAGVQVIAGTSVDYLVEGLGAPNDLMFGPDGRLWVTDTRGEFDIGTPDAGLPGHVYATDIDSGETQQIIDDGPVFINGLGFTRRRLQIACDSHVVVTTAVLPHPDVGLPGRRRSRTAAHLRGRLAGRDGRQRVRRLLGRADRRRQDRDRRRDGSAGREIGLPAGSLATNVCIGGQQSDELFVTAAQSQSLLRVRFDDNDAEGTWLTM